MRLILAAAVALLGMPLVSCTPKDPDLDPQPQMPESSSSRNPWNRPVPGQGGGALGNLPNQGLRR